MPPQAPSTNPGKATSKLQNQLQAEESARNELYTGDGSSRDTRGPENSAAQMTTDQLAKKAQTTHQETTATAKKEEKVSDLPIIPSFCHLIEHTAVLIQMHKILKLTALPFFDEFVWKIMQSEWNPILKLMPAEDM